MKKSNLSNMLDENLYNVLERFNSLGDFEINRIKNYLFGNSRNIEHPLDHKYILHPLSGQNNTYFALDHFKLKKQFSLPKDYKKAGDCLTKPGFNPQRKYLLRDYYVKEKNNFEILSLIIPIANGELIENILYYGPKGSGKTVTQNCWLSENWDNLEYNNIFFVRCDAHKLYELWRDQKDQDQSKLISISDYLNIQFVYILAKYFKIDCKLLVNNIINDIYESNLKFYQVMSRYDDNQKEDKSVWSKLHELNNIIKREENFDEITSTYPAGIPSYAYENVMRQSQETKHYRERRRWLDLSVKIQKFITLEKNYKILFMVDGIDNIEVTDDNSKQKYKLMLTQASTFIYKKPDKNKIHFMAARNESVVILAKYNFVQKTQGEQIPTPAIHSHEASCLMKIFRERIRYVSENKEFLSDLKFKEILEAIIGNNEVKDINYYNEQYHDDVRMYLHNQLSLASLVYFRWVQLGSKKAFNISNQIEKMYSRNKFLNGRLYLNSPLEPPIPRGRGVVAYNPFFFSVSEFSTEENCWPGLCAIRIIQLLNELKEFSSSRNQITDFLVKKFRYPQALVDEHIRKLQYVRMIRTELSDTKEVIRYALTDKGKSLISDIFCDLDVLYYLALDTPLPSYFFKNRLINSHENYKVLSNYAFASISTITTFLLFLKLVEIIETDFFNESSCNIFKNINYKTFKLPINKKYDVVLRNSILENYNGCMAEEKLTIRNFIENLIVVIENELL